MSVLRTIDNYEVDMRAVLGRGGYAIVYKARNIDSGETVAAKKINLEMANLNHLDSVQAKREISSLKAVSHDNLVALLHFCKKDVKNNSWVFLEFCDLGDLQQYFLRDVPGQVLKMKFMLDMTSALKYLHNQHILHRDLKPQNVLIKSVEDGIPVAKISDFGLAKFEESAEGFPTRGIGTHAFMAPELYNEKGRCDAAVDIFALGLTFFSMITFIKGGKLLSPKAEGTSHLVAIGNRMYMLHLIGSAEQAIVYHKELIPVQGGRWERSIRRVIQNMVNFNQEDRFTAPRVFEELQRAVPLADDDDDETNYRGSHRTSVTDEDGATTSESGYDQSVKSGSHMFSTGADARTSSDTGLPNSPDQSNRMWKKVYSFFEYFM